MYYGIAIKRCCLICFSEICGVGRAPNLTDTTQCIDCDVGYYSNVSDATQCTTCPDNTTTISAGSTDSTQCWGKVNNAELSFTGAFFVFDGFFVHDYFYILAAFQKTL